MFKKYFLVAYVTSLLWVGYAKKARCGDCGVNEVMEKCKIVCPPQFCNNSYTDYGVCPENPPCTPGCNCLKDYLRDFDGVCVFNEDCPPPRPNNNEECPDDK